MKYLTKLMLFIIMGLTIQVVYAQGCPPGYFPTTPSGAPFQGCAPMPAPSNNSDYSPPPVKWADRWGTIVIGSGPKNGIFGKSSNMSSKLAAETLAMNDCKLQGGGVMSYCYNI